MLEKRIIVKSHAKERLERGKVYNVTEEALIEIIKIVVPERAKI